MVKDVLPNQWIGYLTKQPYVNLDKEVQQIFMIHNKPFLCDKAVQFIWYILCMLNLFYVAHAY